jgi:hypothetical protein
MEIDPERFARESSYFLEKGNNFFGRSPRRFSKKENLLAMTFILRLW